MNDISEKNKLSSSRRLLIALEEATAKLEAVEHSKTEPIAIIGAGCRFPGNANDLETFWQLLRDGVDAITDIPPERWNVEDYYDPDPSTPGKIYTRSGGFLEQVDQFDPEFFGISTREAVSLDPQQRLLLEVSWEALENSGLAPSKLVGSQTGVFIGIGQNDYANLQLNSIDPEHINAYTSTGNGFCFVSGRLSYFLGLQGPSITIDTACSASLVAIHLACQSLRIGECNLALAGGVQLILSPEVTISLSRANALSPDGRCKTFDATANGYGRGEGCGIIVLKRLSDAITNGDNILALIRGSAVNHGGSSSGLTVPNAFAQQTLIHQALANGGVTPSQVSYVEAHGTGTSLGDPIELRALGAALCEKRTSEAPLIVGSVKTNIGHLEASAGVAGLLKVVLALQHQEIPPHLHFKQPNPFINWKSLPVIVPTKRIPWPSGKKPRIAAVSSFGISGTNAHILLEEAPEKKLETAEVDRPVHLLTLSAKTEVALKQLASRYENYLATNPTLTIGDICFTANTGRSHFNYRLSVVAASTTELREKLSTFIVNPEAAEIQVRRARENTQLKIAFLFTGEDSYYVGIAYQLYQTQPTFRKTLDYCNKILEPYFAKPLLKVLYSTNEDLSLSDKAVYTQLALFAIQYAQAKLWQSWGIQPTIVMGHSLGEYVAACIAGVFSLEDGLKLIAERARLMQSLPTDGQMVAVWASEGQVAAIIEPYAQEIAIAAINSPQNTVISGKSQQVETVVAALEAKGIKTKRLGVSQAFHSHLMNPILAAFEEIAQAITYSTPQIPIVSNVTGELITDEIAKAGYWCRHLRQSVRFAKGIKTLQQRGCEVFVEIGPQLTLLEMDRNCLLTEGVWLPSLRQDKEDWKHLLQSLGELYMRGVPINWFEFDRDYPHRRLVLPTYPFQRQRYWIKTTATRESRKPPKLHVLLNKKLQSPLLRETLFESHLGTEVLSYLNDHQVYEKIVVPGGFYLSLLLGAGELMFKTKGYVLENVLFPQTLVISERELPTIHLLITPEDETKAAFKLISLETKAADENNSWTVHAAGKILLQQKEAVSTDSLQSVFISQVKARCQQQMNGTEFYRALQQHQIQIGPKFQWIETIWRGDREALCSMRVPLTLDGVENYQLHPGLLNACCNLMAATFAAEIEKTKVEETFVPLSLEKFQFYKRPTSPQLWCYASLRQLEAPSEGIFVGDIQLLDHDGQVIAEFAGLESRKVSRPTLLQSLEEVVEDWIYELVWHPKPHEHTTITLPPKEVGSWLIFTAKGEIGMKLAALLKERGERCVLIFPDQAYGIKEEENYYINPAEPIDFHRLLQESIGEHYPPCRGIIHLWGVENPPIEEITLSSLHNAQLLGCGSVLHLIQALTQCNWSQFPRLWLVTKGTKPISPTPMGIQVQQAPLWGLGQVIALEHPDLWGGLIDLDSEFSSNEAVLLLEEIWQPDRENQIAFRNGKRYVARLLHKYDKKIQQNIHKQQQPEPCVDANSTYLITGGLGGLGLTVARWLVEQGARHLLLLGRTDASAAATEVVSALKRGGAKVMIAQADVAQVEQLAKILVDISKSMPPLRGIIHAAGVLDNGVLKEQEWKRFAKVLAPKVEGAWNLHSLTQSMPLDFFVLFSSAASLIGSPGQGNYAAANAFLDTLAHFRHQQGLPALSINWGPWTQVGMAAQFEKVKTVGIAPEQGLQVLKQLLHQTSPQVGILPISNQSQRQQLYLAINKSPLLEYLGDKDSLLQKSSLNESVKLTRDSLLAVEPQRREQALVIYLQEQLAYVLELDSISLDIEQSFNTIGFDSFMALELKNRLEVTLGISIPTAIFLQEYTVTQLAKHILEQLHTTDDRIIRNS